MPTAIHRIDPEIWVLTPKGEGHALFLIDYGPSINSIWIVTLFASGDVIHVDSGEVRVMLGNPMWNLKNPEPFNGREFRSYQCDSGFASSGSPQPKTPSTSSSQ